MEPWTANLPGAAALRAARQRRLPDLGERREALERALGAVRQLEALGYAVTLTAAA